MDSAGGALECAVGKLSRDLLYADGGDRTSARFVRYFGKAPSRLVPDDIVQRCPASGSPDEVVAKVDESVASG